MPFSISSQLSKTLDIARFSDLPVLLIGKQGIGKSEFLREYADIRNFESTVLDLSLLRAEDFAVSSLKPSLINLPNSSSSKQHIIVVKKLNKCEPHIQKLFLQLLITRQIHAYQLPKKTFVVACITTNDVGTCLSTIDSSTLSKFIALPLKADVQSWLRWSEYNNVHPIIQAYVQEKVLPFEKISPRTYVYVSRILKTINYQLGDQSTINSIIESILGNDAQDFIYFMEEWILFKNCSESTCIDESKDIQVITDSTYDEGNDEDQNTQYVDYSPSYAKRTNRKM